MSRQSEINRWIEEFIRVEVPHTEEASPETFVDNHTVDNNESCENNGPNDMQQSSGGDPADMSFEILDSKEDNNENDLELLSDHQSVSREEFSSVVCSQHEQNRLESSKDPETPGKQQNDVKGMFIVHIFHIQEQEFLFANEYLCHLPEIRVYFLNMAAQMRTQLSSQRS